MADDTLETVATFLTRVDADLACGALRAAGIDATITDDDGGGTNPELWMNGVRVQVRTEDAATAKALLTSAAPASPPE